MQFWRTMFPSEDTGPCVKKIDASILLKASVLVSSRVDWGKLHWFVVDT